jgi:hypothetical protein
MLSQRRTELNGDGSRGVSGTALPGRGAQRQAASEATENTNVSCTGPHPAVSRPSLSRRKREA